MFLRCCAMGFRLTIRNVNYRLAEYFVAKEVSFRLTIRNVNFNL